MRYLERPFVFDCRGDSLVSIAAIPETSGETGVLIIVGGPQYRIGSHRQFVLLSRHLAERGIPCMRFDNRSMGDATGAERDFEDIDDDLRAAVDVFFETVPGMRNVVLWGLCGGASAACAYAHRDRRVGGLFLLNPWVRTTASKEKTYIKHYYLDRLKDPAFWRKLISGKVGVVRAITGFLVTARKALGRSPHARLAPGDQPAELFDRMLEGMRLGSWTSVLVLSGRDYVARECEEVLLPHRDFIRMIDAGRCTVIRFPEADHTFSTADHQCALEHCSSQWVEPLGAADESRPAG